MRDRSVPLALLIPMFATAVCCSHPPASVAPTPAPPDPLALDQQARSIEVDAWCPGRPHGGSGVVLGGRDIVTAFHVVTCAKEIKPDPSPRTWVAPTAISIGFPDGRVMSATLIMYAPADDLAYLQLSEDSGLDLVKGQIPPTQGSVCYVTAQPTRSRTCAAVREFRPDEDMEVSFAADPIPGNSGSGVYDEAGRLVAIVTRRGGYASAVARASSWRIP